MQLFGTAADHVEILKWKRHYTLSVKNKNKIDHFS